MKTPNINKPLFVTCLLFAVAGNPSAALNAMQTSGSSGATVGSCSSRLQPSPSALLRPKTDIRKLLHAKRNKFTPAQSKHAYPAYAPISESNSAECCTMCSNCLTFPLMWVMSLLLPRQ